MDNIATSIPGVRLLETLPPGHAYPPGKEAARLSTHLRPGEVLVSVWRHYLDTKAPSDYYACTPGGADELRGWAHRKFRGLGATINQPTA